MNNLLSSLEVSHLSYSHHILHISTFTPRDIFRQPVNDPEIVSRPPSPEFEFF